MKKVIIVIIALVIGAIAFQYDVRATDSYLFNNGSHLNCGGRWVQCERDRTGRWFYCSYCGSQKKF